MAPSRKNITNKPVSEWLIESWKTIIAVFGVISGIFFGGYKTSEFFSQEKLEREQIKMNLQCAEQVRQVEARLQDEKGKERDDKVDGLIEAVKNLQKSKK